MNRPLRAIGLMSGTSMDGIDVAILDTDGTRILGLGASRTLPYSAEDRLCLAAAMDAASGLADRRARPPALAAAEALVTQRHAEAVRALTHDAPEPVDVVGFHGQTVLHRPQARLTVQIGDGAALARMLAGPMVVHDFRAADVAAGGQGAPFVPVYHQALVGRLDLPHPVVVLNLGGVANLTFIDGAADPIACDTGPANALLDDFMAARTGVPVDRDGRAAAEGRADHAALQRLLAHPFFALPPPKSLDRNDFRAWVAAQAGLGAMSTPDGAATLTALTAASIAAAVRLLPRPPRSVIAAGGGAHNPTLLRLLAAELRVPVSTAAQFGWSIDALEAQAFGFLAARALVGLPLSFPTTTGVPRPMPGGVIELYSENLNER